ncbi:MAG: hypothetical protein V4850_24975 [Myxococcota bacterium]
MPFIASASDPFAGIGGESYDFEVSGTGAGGGVGFRGYAQPVVVLITDDYLRDPGGVGLPGGCPGDAAAEAVAEAANAQDAWIVGVLVNGTVAQNQFEYLSVATGQLVDSDGDGAATTPRLGRARASTSTPKSRRPSKPWPPS